MSKTMMNIGFGNYVNLEKVLTILDPNSAPMKRLREEAKQAQKLINATYGRPTRSIIIMDSNHIVLSALQPETLVNRLSSFPKRENE
ncbi:MAG TPA: DUF370 domain-containing protein [Atribacterota bacterium]|nr:DUF370 domain-containing protein [Atribacterota bacterium]HOR42063.1 DUF370 domain-containing protein [Atribacterota bacterium]HPK87686.1 DUF370 domain-containing protein [Atribacterota bacterium]